MDTDNISGQDPVWVEGAGPVAAAEGGALIYRHPDNRQQRHRRRGEPAAGRTDTPSWIQHTAELSRLILSSEKIWHIKSKMRGEREINDR